MLTWGASPNVGNNVCNFSLIINPKLQYFLKYFMKFTAPWFNTVSTVQRTYYIAHFQTNVCTSIYIY